MAMSHSSCLSLILLFYCQAYHVLSDPSTEVARQLTQAQPSIPENPQVPGKTQPGAEAQAKDQPKNLNSLKDLEEDDDGFGYDTDIEEDKRYSRFRSDFGKRLYRADFGKRLYRADFGKRFDDEDGIDKRLYRADFGKRDAENFRVKRAYRSDFGKREVEEKRLYLADFGKRSDLEADKRIYRSDFGKRSLAKPKNHFRADFGKRESGAEVDKRLYRADFGKRGLNKKLYRADFGKKRSSLADVEIEDEKRALFRSDFGK